MTHSREPGLARIGAVLDRLWLEEPKNGIVGPFRSDDIRIEGMRPGKVLGLLVREGLATSRPRTFIEPDGNRVGQDEYSVNLEAATTWFFERLIEEGLIWEDVISTEGEDIPLANLARRI